MTITVDHFSDRLKTLMRVKAFKKSLEKSAKLSNALALKQPKDPVKDHDLQPHSQHDMPDSVEARKKRLQAQRDALI